MPRSVSPLDHRTQRTAPPFAATSTNDRSHHELDHRLLLRGCLYRASRPLRRLRQHSRPRCHPAERMRHRRARAWGARGHRCRFPASNGSRPACLDGRHCQDQLVADAVSPPARVRGSVRLSRNEHNARIRFMANYEDMGGLTSSRSAASRRCQALVRATHDSVKILCCERQPPDRLSRITDRDRTDLRRRSHYRVEVCSPVLICTALKATTSAPSATASPIGTAPPVLPARATPHANQPAPTAAPPNPAAAADRN
jgi:hypothetical protein